MRKGKIITSLLTVVFVLSLSLVLKAYDQQPQPSTLSVKGTSRPKNVATDSALVTRVIDGDTIEISTGQKVRLIGIDTPETVDPRKEVQCFGKAASEYTKNALLNKEVVLVKDVSNTDRYGRLLRYVYLDNEFINEKLVVEGYARASSYPPDIKYQSLFTKSENMAQLQGKGLWKECESK